MGVQKGRVCPDSILLEAHPPGALPLPPPTALHAASFNNGAAWHQHVLHLAYTMCPPSCRVWNLFEEQDLFTRSVRKSTFAVKASERRATNLLPRIAVVVHNRHNVRATRATAAFQHLHNQTAERLFHAFNEACQGEAGPDGSARVFVDKGKPNFEQFQRLFTSALCCGVEGKL